MATAVADRAAADVAALVETFLGTDVVEEPAYMRPTELCDDQKRTALRNVVNG